MFVCGWVSGGVFVWERGVRRKGRERVSERKKRRATSKLDASGREREVVTERRENAHVYSL